LQLAAGARRVRL